MAWDIPLGNIDSVGEYQGRISVYDNISVAKGALSVNLHYRIDSGEFIADTMVYCGGSIYSFSIPGQPVGTQVDYYIDIRDAMDNFITTPPNAPDSLYSFNVLPPTGIYDKPVLSGYFSLQISPNPSNSGFMVSYMAEEELKISIYDLLGRMLHSEYLPVGASDRRQSWRWSGWGRLATGIYFIELSGADRKEVKKALLIR